MAKYYESNSKPIARNSIVLFITLESITITINFVILTAIIITEELTLLHITIIYYKYPISGFITHACCPHCLTLTKQGDLVTYDTALLCLPSFFLCLIQQLYSIWLQFAKCPALAGLFFHLFVCLFVRQQPSAHEL